MPFTYQPAPDRSPDAHYANQAREANGRFTSQHALPPRLSEVYRNAHPGKEAEFVEHQRNVGTGAHAFDGAAFAYRQAVKINPRDPRVIEAKRKAINGEGS